MAQDATGEPGRERVTDNATEPPEANEEDDEDDQDDGGGDDDDPEDDPVGPDVLTVSGSYQLN